MKKKTVVVEEAEEKSVESARKIATMAYEPMR